MRREKGYHIAIAGVSCRRRRREQSSLLASPELRKPRDDPISAAPGLHSGGDRPSVRRGGIARVVASGRALVGEQARPIRTPRTSDESLSAVVPRGANWRIGSVLGHVAAGLAGLVDRQTTVGWRRQALNGHDGIRYDTVLEVCSPICTASRYGVRCPQPEGTANSKHLRPRFGAAPTTD